MGKANQIHASKCENQNKAIINGQANSNYRPFLVELLFYNEAWKNFYLLRVSALREIPLLTQNPPVARR